MEAGFGHDFGQVRVHSDARAGESARAVGAAAYAAGRHLVFAPGRYAPGSADGDRLLAHELAHVVRHGGGDATPTAVAAGEQSAADEREADAVADRVLESAVPKSPSTQAPAGAAATVLCRQPDDDASRATDLRNDFYQAVTTEDWGRAAVILNGFNDSDIRALLNELTSGQLEQLRAGAMARMQGWSDRVVKPLEAVVVGRQESDRVAALERDYAAAVASAEWSRAATLLNGYNNADIRRKIDQLSPEQARGLRDAAPAWAARVIEAAEQSVGPVASRVQPTPVQADAGAPSRDVAAMSGVDKLAAAYEYADLGAAAREEIARLVTPKALCIAIISFVGVFVVSQLTPVGWAADIGLALTAVFIGSALFDAIGHLRRFAAAVDATSEDDLKRAGKGFADAVAGIGINAIILLVTHGVGGKGSRGAAPYEGPPPSGFADVLTDTGLVVRAPVAAIPQFIPVVQAAELGAKGAAAATAATSMMSSMGGPGSKSSGGGAKSGGGARSGGGQAGSHTGPSVVIDPATGVPRQLSGTVKVGPAFPTFEEAFAAKAHPDAHVAEVVLRGPDGETIANWWEVSERLKTPGVGRAGDTEQKALVRVFLKIGQVLEINGGYPPCSGCDTAMQVVAEEAGAEIVYRTTDGRVYQFPRGDF